MAQGGWGGRPTSLCVGRGGDDGTAGARAGRLPHEHQHLREEVEVEVEAKAEEYRYVISGGGAGWGAALALWGPHLPGARHVGLQLREGRNAPALLPARGHHGGQQLLCAGCSGRR